MTILTPDHCSKGLYVNVVREVIIEQIKDLAIEREDYKEYKVDINDAFRCGLDYRVLINDKVMHIYFLFTIDDDDIMIICDRNYLIIPYTQFTSIKKHIHQILGID